jgi:hypothetical protein
MRLLITALLCLALTTGLCPADPKPNFTGSYALAAKKTDRQFSLDVEQNGERAKVNFSAAMTDGTGAAPDAEGSGKIEDGVLSFKFKDSYDNEGTCTLQRLPNDAYELAMTVTKVVEASPFHFYGKLLLKKVSDHPADQ